MIIPRWLQRDLEGKEPLTGPAWIVDKGIRNTWEIPGLILDMLNRDRGKGLKGGLAPRLSHVRKQDAIIREQGRKGIGGTEVTRPHDWFTRIPTSESNSEVDAVEENKAKTEQQNKTDLLNQLPEGVSQTEFDAWNNKRIKEELRQNIDDPRYDAKREAFKRVPKLQNRNFKNRERGGSRWVGVNSEWQDRYGNVIAPRENFNSSVDRKGEPISVKKQLPKIGNKISVGDGKTFNPQAGGFVGDVGELKYNSAFQMPTKDNITFNKDAPRIAPMQPSPAALNKLKFGFGDKVSTVNTLNAGSEIFAALAKYQASKQKTPRSQSSPAPIPQLAAVQNPESFYSLLG